MAATTYCTEPSSRYSQIFPLQTDQEFHKTIRTHLESELEGLDGGALLGAKKLLRAGLSEKNNPDAVNLRESYGERPGPGYISSISERFVLHSSG